MLSNNSIDVGTDQVLTGGCFPVTSSVGYIYSDTNPLIASCLFLACPRLLNSFIIVRLLLFLASKVKISGCHK